MERRTFLRGAGLAALALAASPVLGACSSGQPTPRGYSGSARPLPIPPLAEGELIDAVRTFRLDASAVDAQILPDVTTPAWGFNGGHLGPTLRLRRGEDVRMNVHNGLDEMTTIHWHGMKLPAVSDGGPHQPIEPGQTWTPQWRVEQPAATLWYHPHPHERTALHAYRGLAGMILIEDEVSDGLDLPRSYGVDDIPVAIMDQKFRDDGRLDETSDPDLGLKGDTPTVNGITHAYFDATTATLRLRLLNAATMRFYRLSFSDERPFHVVATDSGFLPHPIEVTHLPISPGERAEIVVDLEAGEKVTLVSGPFDDNFGVPEDEYSLDFGLQDSFDLLEIRAVENLVPAVAVPATLAAEAAREVAVNGAVEREFVLNTFQINGQSMDMSRVDVTIDHQGPEIWTVTNENADWIHNFHIHDSAFKVLSLDGTEADVFTRGWKDTVALPPGATARLAVEFGYYPDPHWAYMYHCHMLLHEDSGMMGQFVIAPPGERAALAGEAGHAHG
ncbi:multicopper oxidase domain-containing protein [Corynebacterium sp. zg-331]|uniref:multicopper oxidase family protein n=1 Tax=unclassified Corynebacterium TaxID=2624378 RepID=UPI00140049E4|nr:multicopper oxidase domain-containing protein [Corynebacterium sp. zg-331]MPV53271.1 multicopper oxidase domain-containing protein [Corynebacterium sp. zg331]